VFTERAAELGIDFTHFDGRTGNFALPEIYGSGAALCDLDGDGDLDVYLVQSGELRPGSAPAPWKDRLFRNDRGRFVDVTEASGLDARGYGQAVACGDVDNDGWPDLYIANYGPDQLWHNRGDATFEDVTAERGLGNPRWGLAAAFVDVDRDGWLDLYVGNYLLFDPASAPTCHTRLGKPDYCGPLSFQRATDLLFRNRGDGRFENVSLSSGVGAVPAYTLGVSVADFDDDGWLDLYVAADQMPNLLWINRHDRTFEDRALMSGAAVNGLGVPEASMGVDAGDFDGDGDEDLFMAHFTGESNTLFRNDGAGNFTDESVAVGLAAPSLASTGFATAWLDFDNDGWLDVMVVNGAAIVIEELRRAGDPFPFRQPDQLFRNLGDGRFEEVAGERSGLASRPPEVGRGAAFGDLDDDGDTDVVVVNNSGPAQVWINQVGQDRAWIGLRLVGRDGRRDQLGARVAVLRANAPPLWRRARADGSYASSNDPRVLVGLDRAEAIDGVGVIWPDGARERWGALAVRRYHTLRQGTGEPWP